MRGLACHQRADFAVGAPNDLLILVDFAGVQHQPVDPAEHICMFLGDEIIVGAAGQFLEGSAHEIAHASVHHEEAGLAVLHEYWVRNRVQHEPHGVGIIGGK